MSDTEEEKTFDSNYEIYKVRNHMASFLFWSG